MQGWQYGKGLIYLRPIFQLTKLAFLRARATMKENTSGGGGGGGTGGVTISRLPYVFVPLFPDSGPLLCFSRYHVNHAV